MEGMERPEEEGAKETGTTQNAGTGSKPAFNVKAKGEEGFVGSGWVNNGKYGEYISVSLRKDMPNGAKLYLYPRRREEEQEA